MEDFLGQAFFIMMFVGVPLLLGVGAIVAYMQYKKQDKMFDELDDEALDEMADENKGE